MKIGFSFGKCVRDIVNGVVDIDDVVVIVARTMVDEEHLDAMIEAYGSRRDYLLGLDIQSCKDVANALWKQGKIHQPRSLGLYAGWPAPEGYVWMDLYPTLDSDNPAVKAAWSDYRMVLKLAEGPAPKEDFYDDVVKSWT